MRFRKTRFYTAQSLEAANHKPGGNEAIGVCAAVVFSRVMDSLVFGISPLDPVTFVTMLVVLTGAALLASYLPARRALDVDPVGTMRAE